MKIYRLLPCIFLLTIGCSTSQQSNQEEKEQSQVQYTLLPDSLFFQSNAREFTMSLVREVEKSSKRLFSVPDSIKGQIFNCLGARSQVLGADYYSIVKQEKGATAFVLLVSTMQSKNLVLVTFSDGFRVSSCIQLTKDMCDLIEQNEEGEIIGCNVKYAYLEDSGDLRLISVVSKEFDYGSDSRVEVDSVTSIYNITNEGMLNLLNQDTVRFMK